MRIVYLSYANRTSPPIYILKSYRISKQSTYTLIYTRTHVKHANIPKILCQRGPFGNIPKNFSYTRIIYIFLFFPFNPSLQTRILHTPSLDTKRRGGVVRASTRELELRGAYNTYCIYSRRGHSRIRALEFLSSLCARDVSPLCYMSRVDEASSATVVNNLQSRLSLSLERELLRRAEDVYGLD